MVTGDNIPDNANANSFDLNTGGWILIAILIAIIVILFIIAIEIHTKNEKKIRKLEEFYKIDLSEKERKLLTQYRNLNETDKTIIEDTIKSLNTNHINNKHKND